MPGFYGLRTVLATRNKQRRTGKLFSSTLTKKAGPNKGKTSTYVDSYPWPSSESSGVGGLGRAWDSGPVTLYRVNNEAYAPRPDDELAIAFPTGAVSVRINAVVKRLNADERPNADEDVGFAVYDLDTATT